MDTASTVQTACLLLWATFISVSLSIAHHDRLKGLWHRLRRKLVR